jgi:hypothetical protein
MSSTRYGHADDYTELRDLDMLRRRATVSENAVQSGSQIFVGTPESVQPERLVGSARHDGGQGCTGG